MAEKYTAEEVEEAFAAGRDRMAKILGLKEDSGLDFRAAQFKFPDATAVKDFQSKGGLLNNLRAKDMSLSLIITNETYLNAPLPKKFFADPNAALTEFYEAAKQSGLAQNMKPQDVRLTDKQVQIIKWATVNSQYEDINDKYENRIIKRNLEESGSKYPKEVRAAAAEIKIKNKNANIPDGMALAAADLKLGVDKKLGTKTEADISANSISYTVENTAQLGKDVRKRLSEMEKSGLVETGTMYIEPRATETKGRSFLTITPTPEFAAQLLKNSPQSKQVIGDIYEKQSIAHLDQDFYIAARDGANAKLLDSIRSDLGIKATPIKETGTATPRQTYELLQQIEAAVPQGFSDKEKQDINAKINDIAKNLKTQMTDADNLTAAEKTDAADKTTKIITTATQAIDKRSAPERPH